MTLVKADLGTKRVCPSCSARFYDLQKRPIACPKCAVTFEPEALYKQRRPRQPEVEKVPERVRDEEELQESEEVAEDAEGTAAVAVKGANVSINANATAELKGGAMVTVQGALVKIN